MKALRYIIAAFLSLVALTGCESKRVKAGREAYMRYYNRFVADKASIKIIDEKFEEEKEKSLITWTVIMECKTLYGETVRDTNSFITKGKRVIMVNDDFYFDDLIDYGK